MPWLSTDKSKNERISYSRPTRIKLRWVFNFDDTIIWLPEGSIKRLIGRELTWEDEPVEFTEVKEMKCLNDYGQCGIGGNCTICPDTVLDRAINSFTQAQLLAMPQVTDHYDLVKYGLVAALKEYGIEVKE